MALAFSMQAEISTTMDCAVLGGLGYRFTNHIFLDIRYLHGLTETCRLYEGGKTRNIQFSLGYLF